MKKIILILLTFLLSLTLISCKDKTTTFNKDEVVDDINTPQYELNDYYSDKIKQLIYKDAHKNKEGYDIKEEKIICLNRIEDSFIIYYWCYKQYNVCLTVGDFVRLDIEIDDLTFSHSYIATELCHEEISNLYLYKDETLLSLSEAYEKEYVNYDQLEYAWETYYLCKGYSKEYVEELKNLPIKLEEVTNKAIEFFPQFIENYNDNDYKLEISVKKYRYLIEKLINKLGNNAPYEVFKVNEIDIYENGEQINTVYVGYTLGEEDKIWLMISVSNDNSINYIRVLEQNETDYPYEEDYDFDLIGAKSEEFGYNDSNYIEVQPKFIINSESQDVLSAVYRFAVLVLQK